MFYWDDSGRDDKTRVIVVTTEGNLRLLQSNTEWLGDGSFDLAPKTVFKQVYTIHIIYKNKYLPMVYGFLPNKTQKTLKKFFKINKDVIKVLPLAVYLFIYKRILVGGK